MTFIGFDLILFDAELAVGITYDTVIDPKCQHVKVRLRGLGQQVREQLFGLFIATGPLVYDYELVLYAVPNSCDWFVVNQIDQISSTCFGGSSITCNFFQKLKYAHWGLNIEPKFLRANMLISYLDEISWFVDVPAGSVCPGCAEFRVEQPRPSNPSANCSSHHITRDWLIHIQIACVCQ